MRLSGISNFVTSKIGRQILTTQKHAPVLLFGVGVAGFIGTVALGVRSTLKLDEVLDEAEAEVTRVKEAENKGYSEKDRKKDLATIHVRSAIKVARLYAPAVAVGVLTIVALSSSHVILTRRNAGLAAAYATIHQAFGEYRQRVVAELGEDKDREFKFGKVVREVAVDTDDGIAVKTIAHFADASGYARIFDKLNFNWSSEADYNYIYLRNVQNYLNDRLKSRGRVFLNEAYEELGFEPTKAGQIVGWVLKDGYEEGDGYIDFGLNSESSREFACGYEKSVVLDFNVDGPILDQI